MEMWFGSAVDKSKRALYTEMIIAGFRPISTTCPDPPPRPSDSHIIFPVDLSNK